MGLADDNMSVYIPALCFHKMCFIKLKYCIRETLNLLTDADSSSDTKTDRNGQKRRKFEVGVNFLPDPRGAGHAKAFQISSVGPSVGRMVGWSDGRLDGRSVSLIVSVGPSVGRSKDD